MLTPDQYASSLMAFVQDSPSSYHAAACVVSRLDDAGFTAVDESVSWSPSLPSRGYIVRDGAVAAWVLPKDRPARAWRIVGAHTDSPALKLKPYATRCADGWTMLGAEIYGGALLTSFLDRDLGLAGRLTTRDGAVHLVRTGAIARVPQLAPHLDRSQSSHVELARQGHMAPFVALSTPGGEPEPIENHLCALAGIDPDDLAFCDVVTYPAESPRIIGLHGEFIASSRLDNLSSVHAGLVALEEYVRDCDSCACDEPDDTARDAVVFIANDHEEVGSNTRSGAAGPMLESLLTRLALSMGIEGDAYHAMIARSSCISADAGHSVNPNYAEKHDPTVRPVVNGGPLLKINATQRYATDAVGAAIWKRACRAAGVPTQDFVSHNDIPCGSTIGPITATRLGITTVDVGVPLLSMHSQREMCGVEDGPYLARALHAYWMGA